MRGSGRSCRTGFDKLHCKCGSMIRLVGEWLLDEMKENGERGIFFRCTSQFPHANCCAQLSVKGQDQNMGIIEDTVHFQIEKRLGSGKLWPSLGDHQPQ